MTPCVVVADNEAHVTRIVSMKLERAGFEVHAATTMDAAWVMVGRWSPGLVIASSSLVGGGGATLLRRIRKTHAIADLPVIYLVDHRSSEAEIEIVNQLGVTATVSKPFSPRDLVQLCQELWQTAAMAF